MRHPREPRPRESPPGVHSFLPAKRAAAPGGTASVPPPPRGSAFSQLRSEVSNQDLVESRRVRVSAILFRHHEAPLPTAQQEFLP